MILYTTNYTENPQHYNIIKTDTGFKYQVNVAILTSSMDATKANIESGNMVSIDYVNQKYANLTPILKTSNYNIYPNPNNTIVTVNFDDYRNSRDFSDHSIFFIYDSEIYPNNGTRFVDPRLNLNPKFNTFAQTLTAKINNTHYSILSNEFKFITLNVPFASSINNDWLVGLNLSTNELLSVSDDITVVSNTINVLDDIANMLPKIYFSQNNVTCSTNSSVDIPFFIGDNNGNPIVGNDCDVYFESTGGLLPVTRVTTSNGQGLVKVATPFNSVGDQFKVKCGFKYFTGTDDCVINVI